MQPDMQNGPTQVWVLTVAYDGKPFAGFQSQEGLPTVQSAIEVALATALRRPASITAAGRTDAGVHAFGQVVSFEAAEDDPAPDVLMRSLNALAAPHVSVRDARITEPGFSARHSAIRREYRYRLVPGPVPPLFTRDVAWWVKGRLDLDAMRRASRALIGEHDFRSFCTTQFALTGKSTRRSIDLIEVEEACELGEQLVVVRVVGRAFLHSMVRIVTGTLVDVGRSKRPESWVAEALQARDRAAAGRTAPAHGLTLWRVDYPDDGL